MNILSLDECHKDFLKYKRQMMGLAILLVVLCHSTIISWRPLKLFNLGMVGCDIFMILSGASLAYSYKKYSLYTFHWKYI